MTGPSSGPLITNEQVFEKLFRAGYARWVEEAKKRLGPDAVNLAPKVVSKAFHSAWMDRKRLFVQDELDAFLGANIQHGAARELSRKAGAARMAHGEGHKETHAQHTMTVDEAWEGLKRTLVGGVAPEAMRERASAARHETADHFNKLAAEKFNWKPLVAIGAIGLAIGIGGFMYVDKAGADRAITHALNAQDARPYETSFGQSAKVTLDDSTIVQIGPETKLIVPKMFNIELRAVRVEGTANFEVIKTMELPYEVRAGEVAILSTGGVFTVRRFKDDAALVIHARKGALNVKLGETVRNVAEGLSLMVDSAGEMSVPSTEQLAEASSWVDGNVSIEGRNLRDALPQLKRWFGLDIKVPDATLLERKVFIRAKLGSRQEAISAVEQSGGLKFTYIGENMAFQDTLPSRGRRNTKGR
jgi:ferric-dicitrate binding protein FerR (iron transport regulator)